MISTMLTLHAIMDEDYWLRQVAGIRPELGADGITRYYSEAGESPGIFCGRGAVALGLAGRSVSPDENAEIYHRLLAGQDIETGEQLVKGPVKGERVKGWDGLISAPKSVSALWALGGDEVMAAIESAHAQACQAAFGHFDDVVAYGRRGHGGVTQIETDGLNAASFQHRCSRCGDPSLHTHHVIANMVKGIDGKWSALDARLAHANAKESGYLYQAELRLGITEELAKIGLSVHWGPVINGQADIVGVDRGLMKLFSKRHDEIAEDLAARGLEPTSAAQELAKRRTRPQKESGKTTHELVAGWLAEAREAGYEADPATLRRAVNGHQRAAIRPAEMTPALARRLAVALTEEANTFGLRDVVMAVASDFQAGISTADAIRLAGEFLETKEVVGLGRAAELRTGDVITLSSGRSIPVPGVDQAVWSTPGVVAKERSLIEWAVARREAAVGMARPVAVTEALAAQAAAHPEKKLDDEQGKMVHGLCEDGKGVSVVRAPAGAGKTLALGVAAKAWKASGYHVVGLAAVTRNAEAMSALGIASTNIDAVLTQLEGREQSAASNAAKEWVRVGFKPRTIVIVDEAERMRLDHWTRLAHQIALSQDCKLVVLGDEKQKGAIGLQGPFRMMAEKLDAYKLGKNWRQENEWERVALAALREASADQPELRQEMVTDALEARSALAEAALAAYEQHGRVHYAQGSSAKAREELRQEIVTDALEARSAARAQGKDVLMLTDTVKERDRLNKIARARLVDNGEVKAEQARTYAGLELAPGDEIQTQRQARRDGITNGWVLRVIQCDPKSVTAVRIGRGPRFGEQVVIPSWYFAHFKGVRGAEYAHARTTSKEVGATALDSFLLTDLRSVDHAGLYTGASRGERNHLYSLGQPEAVVDYDMPQATHTADKAEPGRDRDAFLRGMTRDRETLTALDTIDALERGELAAATHAIAVAAESTLTHAGVSIDPSLGTVDQADRDALLRGMIRDPQTLTALDVIDALERGDLAAATHAIAAEAESTLTHAGVPLTLDTEAELVEVPAAAAGLESSEVEAAIRTHSGDPLPEPEAEATAAIVARTKAKDQADAQAERDRTDHGPNADDERPRRRRDRRREQELKP
jgi:conjugative relaxase-like TrwC/TraI family protein